MMRLNNKGQSLVLFILIIPIILGIMALVIDLGNALTKKNEIDKNIEFVLDYYLNDNKQENEYLETDNSIDTNSLKVLLEYNLKDIDTTINVDGEVITIKAEAYVEGIFSKILNIKGFRVISEYKGYLESKIQEKIK